MSYEKVMQAKHLVIGTKQTVKAIRARKVRTLVLADDADPNVKGLLQKAAAEAGVEVQRVDSKDKLGKACGISVSAAAAAIIM